MNQNNKKHLCPFFNASSSELDATQLPDLFDSKSNPKLMLFDAEFR